MNIFILDPTNILDVHARAVATEQSGGRLKRVHAREADGNSSINIELFITAGVKPSETLLKPTVR